MVGQGVKNTRNTRFKFLFHHFFQLKKWSLSKKTDFFRRNLRVLELGPSTYSGGRGSFFFFEVKFSFFVIIFRWVCHMGIKLIFSKSPTHGGYFEYPCYGGLTHRKIFGAIWISKNTPKMAIFCIFDYGYPYEKLAKYAIFSLFRGVPI